MASVINLNRFRKAKKRVAAAERAAENRAAFGRTKEERKTAERKPMKVARCARKLLHIAFVVVTRQHAFDPDYQSTTRLPVQKVSTAS